MLVLKELFDFNIGRVNVIAVGDVSFQVNFFGRMGEHEKYSFDTIAEALDQYDEILLEEFY